MLVRSELDPETDKVTILRFVAAQDVGNAIHPSYVEGQIQGGSCSGSGRGSRRRRPALDEFSADV